MSYKRIEPKTERAKLDVTGLKRDFPKTYEVVKKQGLISLLSLGADWNTCTFTGVEGKAIKFGLRDEFRATSDVLKGSVKDIGHQVIGIEVENGNHGANFNDNYIIRTIAEASHIVGKLEITEDEILPSGNTDTMDAGHINRNGENVDVEEYRQFVFTLLTRSRKIIQPKKKSEGFEGYMVVESNQGFFIAYDPGYGKGPYIVSDYNLLLLDKQTLIKECSKDVIRFRRDNRGPWTERILGFM